MSTETALTVAGRAAIAIGAPAYEIALVDLVKESASIVQIKDKSGYQQAHSARMRLKGTRVEIQKRAKDAREDAQAFSKAVIAEEKRLVALVCPEEDRLQGLKTCGTPPARPRSRRASRPRRRGWLSTAPTSTPSATPPCMPQRWARMAFRDSSSRSSSTT